RAGARGQGSARGRQLPRVRDLDHRGGAGVTAASYTGGTSRPTSTHGPVTDWATDLDHADPAYNENAHQIWPDLRASGCPVARSERYGGMWAPLTHELVQEVAYDTDRFSSQGVVVANSRPFVEAPVGPAPPITSDPPFHQIARRLLLPPFAPKAIAEWEPEVRRLCNELLDRVGDVVAGDPV